MSGFAASWSLTRVLLDLHLWPALDSREKLAVDHPAARQRLPGERILQGQTVPKFVHSWKMSTTVFRTRRLLRAIIKF